MDILERIKSNIETITEVDIKSWIIVDILELYKPRITYWAKKVENNFDNISELAIKAFTEEIKQRLINSLNTFIIKKKHWKNKEYNINTYLLSTIKNFAKEKSWLNDCIKKTNILICPACRINNQKIFLIPEDGLWRCPTCTENKEQLISDRSVDENSIARAQSRYRLYNTFALHSRKGYKCPDCDRFIPDSSVGKYGITCPYENCSYSGDPKQLKVIHHPSTVSNKKNLSLNNAGPVNTGIDSAYTSKYTYQDRLIDKDHLTDTTILVNDSFEKDYKILIDVINDQIDSIIRSGLENTKVKKLLMYKAYKNLIDSSPDEMIAYLVHLKNNHDFPIQFKIFQEYVRLIENYLPFSIKKNGKDINILSLTDPNLALFSGKSEFKAVVDDNHIIPNNTEEIYVGKRKFKNYGPCFIGRLIDVIDDTTNTSIKDHVIEYNFVQIILDNYIKVNTPVIVKHFRMPSHYEMGSLVPLQRIRRQIVDSVYFRMNNKKRPLKA